MQQEDHQETPPNVPFPVCHQCGKANQEPGTFRLFPGSPPLASCQECLSNTAHHEAAHAVTRIKLGLLFEFVTIVPKWENDGDFIKSGSVRYPDAYDENPTLEHARNTAISYIAPEEYGFSFSALDLDDAKTILRVVYPDDLDMWEAFSEVRSAAKGLGEAAEVQAAVATLAEELLRKGTLTEAEAKAIAQPILAKHACLDRERLP